MFTLQWHVKFYLNAFVINKFDVSTDADDLFGNLTRLALHAGHLFSS